MFESSGMPIVLLSGLYFADRQPDCRVFVRCSDKLIDCIYLKVYFHVNSGSKEAAEIQAGSPVLLPERGKQF